MEKPLTSGARPDESEDARVAEIVARGPQGALVLAALAVGIVVAMWIVFYLFVFLPRGSIG